MGGSRGRFIVFIIMIVIIITIIIVVTIVIIIILILIKLLLSGLPFQYRHYSLHETEALIERLRRVSCNGFDAYCKAKIKWFCYVLLSSVFCSFLIVVVSTRAASVCAISVIHTYVCLTAQVPNIFSRCIVIFCGELSARRCVFGVRNAT